MQTLIRDTKVQLVQLWVFQK